MQEGRDPIRDMIAESGLDADDYAGVADALATLRSVVPADPPTPSAELAALLTAGTVVALRPRRNSLAVASGVTAALVLASGVAAATNNLPDPLQRFAHDVSEKVLPFEFPDPDRHAQGREGPVQLPEQAKNDTDQGKHVGKGEGGGKTANPGSQEGKAPDKPGKPDARPTTPPTPTPPAPDRPDKPVQGGGEDPGEGDPSGPGAGEQGDQGDQGEDSPSDATTKGEDPGDGGNKGGGKSGDRSLRQG